MNGSARSKRVAVHNSTQSTNSKSTQQWLEDDVFEALEEEERIKHEWIVEREIDAIRAARHGVVDAGRRRRPSFPQVRDQRAARLPGVRADRSVHSSCRLPEPDEVPDVPERVITLMVQEKPKPKPIEVPVQPPKQIVAGQAGRKGRAAEGRQTGRAGAEAGRRTRSGARHSRVPREARFVQGRADRGARFKGEDQQCRRIVRATAAVDADDKRAGFQRWYPSRRAESQTSAAAATNAAPFRGRR